VFIIFGKMSFLVRLRAINHLTYIAKHSRRHIWPSKSHEAFYSGFLFVGFWIYLCLSTQRHGFIYCL